MKFLRLLDTIRSITGRRLHDRFPTIEPPTVVFRPDGGGTATFVVCDAQQARAVLQSSRYRQCDFLAQILTIAKPERTAWIRRFCDIGLIMVDGAEHQRRRQLMHHALERCAAGVREIPDRDIDAVIEEVAAVAPVTADAIASRLVRLLFSRSIAALTGTAAELPSRDLFAVDFFNPFPTLSSLARCDEAIGNCCRAVGLESLDESEQAAVLSLLLMGVSPLLALLTALINAVSSALREGLTPVEALHRAEGVDSYAIVPTNFVMRTCVAADTIGDEAVEPGDAVYLFLGSASGCPFSRLTSVPFGAGRHYCSGAALTQAMVNVVRSGLGRTRVDLRRISPSRELQGKAAAFLAYESGFSCGGGATRP